MQPIHRTRWGLVPVLCLGITLVTPLALGAQAGTPLDAELARRAAAVMPKVVTWRRDIHQHPELGNREFRTARLVADHLRALGLQVRTGVAHTGVVGVLVGGRPGPVVALRADMDALPVTEQVDLPFASRETAEHNGQKVGVMHACGHDNHVAILMGAAEVLAGMRAQLPGTVKFIFQPAEEGPPAGEEGGADLMVKQGVLDNPTPAAVFGLHVGVAPATVGTISYRSGPLMATADNLRIVVRGRQTHGATPWGGIDPVVIAAQIVTGLQTIASRQVDVTGTPTVVTIGTIQGGVRHNIIPDSVVMTGTVRTFEPRVQKDVHERIRRAASAIAESGGATADVRVDSAALLTYNDPALARWAAPVFQRVAGEGKVAVAPLQTGAEDFASFHQRIPGLYFFLGAVPVGQDPATAPRNHSPRFFVDEGVLPLGVRVMTHLAVDFLRRSP